MYSGNVGIHVSNSPGEIVKSRINVTIANDGAHGRYYGFTLSKSRDPTLDQDMSQTHDSARFLLGNCVVTHNSWVVRDLMYHHRDIPSGIVMSGSEQASPFYQSFIPKVMIHDTFDSKLLENVLHVQEKRLKRAKAKGQSADGKTRKNSMFVILDDLMFLNSRWTKDTNILNLTFNGRHFNIMMILTLQYSRGIPPAIRSNLDYVFIFSEKSILNKRKLYEEYVSCVPTFKQFCSILDQCTMDHCCLVVKTTGLTPNLEDNLFWYKAKERTNFRVCDPLVWKYNELNYKPTEDEDEQRGINDHGKYNDISRFRVVLGDR